MRLLPSVKTLLLLVVLGGLGNRGVCEQNTGRGPIPFLYFGNVLLVDPAERTVKLCGSLSPAAPTVAADAAGFLWGRQEPNFLAALDPATGRIVGRVPLRYKVYNHLITPQGKAYVTHHTLTQEGFTVSVIDTRQKRLVKEIKNIAGLRTGLAQGNGFVYLATLGVQGEDDLHQHLYRIDIETDQLQEIYQSPQPGYYWRIGILDDLLYIAFLPTPQSQQEARIEVMELRTLQIVHTAGSAQLGRERSLSGLWCGQGKLFLTCRTATGHHEVLVADGRSLEIREVLPLPGPIDQILGYEGGILLYADRGIEAWTQGISLCFYDTRERKEARKVNIPQFLAANKEESH